MYPTMSSPNSRKRPAPGASPVVPMQQMQQPTYSAAQPDQGLLWDGGAVGNSFVDSAQRTVNPYGMMSPPAQYRQGIAAPPSTIVARRGMSQALVPTASRQAFDPNSGSWANFGDESFLQQPNSAMDENDNIELLEERAARAKRESQIKRKQIPPFVQKLSSFLDESKNTELIRWSDKGDSFVVLDEDEFAKTLIPELFKHNNYASFVRQLNMYGFHKRVGLSDNSMKASERKNKSPSEYYNPYFKRGHPNLLWLINKPKGGNKKKGAKKEDGDADSDDEGAPDETLSAAPLSSANNTGGRSAPAAEVGPLQKKDLVQVKSQLEKLQQQQVAISQLIERLRQDHNQLITQALMFQTMHDRHENSINAILNFLANVFRKSLEEQGGAQSVSDLLASIIPGSQQMPQGSVVDLGDFVRQQARDTASGSASKRPPRLLPPIPNQAKPMKASPPSNTSQAAQAPQAPYQSAQQIGSITELFDTPPSDTSSPAYIKNDLRTNPQQRMMKIIQDTNAGGTSGIDLPDVAANTPVTMSHEQRSKMLDIMAGQASAGLSSTPAMARPTSAPPIPPSHAATSGSPNMSLSPVFPEIQPPSLYEIRNNQAELEALQQMQIDQAAKLNELSAFLGPLSPSGRIPGVDKSGNQTDYFDNVDYDQFLDTSALNDLGYNGDFAGAGPAANTDGNDFNFSLDAPNDAATGGVPDVGGGGLAPGLAAEYGSGNNTPSPAGTEEILRNDLSTPERDAKRRRKF